MFVEPPRAQSAARRPARPVLSLRLRNAALVAAGVLTVTGRADLWTVAIALGVADAAAVTSLVVLLAGVATLARIGSASLSDIAGSQAVLGAAGFTGSTAAITAAWLSGVSLLLVARDRWTGLALGGLGGLLVAGPSLAGGTKSVGVWVLGAAIGAAAGWFVAPTENRDRWQQWVAVGVGVVAVSLGLIAGYS